MSENLQNFPPSGNTDRRKPPAFQWYPGDHRRDAALQACSFEARALWREMLDLMHDGEPYGHLTAGGVPIAPAELARIVGVPLPRVRKWLAELEARHIFSRTDVGVIYSRRMARDERIRRARAAGGIKSLDNPKVPRRKEGRAEGYPSDGPTDDPSGSASGGPLQSAVCDLQGATTSSFGGSAASADVSRESPKRARTSKTARTARRESWVTKAGQIVERIRPAVAAPYGEIGRALKPLVDRDGWENVEDDWARFVASNEWRFRPSYFPANRDRYREGGAAVAPRPGSMAAFLAGLHDLAQRKSEQKSAEPSPAPTSAPAPDPVPPPPPLATGETRQRGFEEIRAALGPRLTPSRHCAA